MKHKRKEIWNAVFNFFLFAHIWKQSDLLFVQDISSVYQIFADEVLGSGQFGVVYGGETDLHFNFKPNKTRSRIWSH